ncbi:MAG TPA: hypothetical protein VFZ14_15440, partial [Burkholderiales bacterium]|nr:hypothetical protein [Burkholderiales bacterium]
MKSALRVPATRADMLTGPHLRFDRFSDRLVATHNHAVQRAQFIAVRIAHHEFAIPPDQIRESVAFYVESHAVLHRKNCDSCRGTGFRAKMIIPSRQLRGLPQEKNVAS